MYLQKFNKKGDGFSEVVKWILYIAIIVAVGFAVRKIAMQFG